MAGVYYVFETRLGWVGIAGADGGIQRLVLPLPSKRQAEKAVKEGMREQLVESKHDFSGEAARLRAYFRGERVKFKCEVDAAGSSAFDRRVWAAAREIGYGRVETYGWIAARIGQPHAARAVGQALGRNPVPIIVPCHRVIRSDGRLGGFSAGLEWKIRLLDMEKHA
ncbi:MAG TPA: methylated-DNA--[protein]-cysteine S-methyltransferase [Armatimonadota bacterium]|nr:methylated-DNA--[protein]-cysteine S-methyltransferase [Armatimonadota bacterium]